MPPGEVDLNVTLIGQDPGLCGAAVGQMLLHKRGYLGTTMSEQRTLFEKIQNHTYATRPTSGTFESQDCPQWSSQRCDRCQGVTTWTCWCSFPPALVAAVSAAGVSVVEAHFPDDAGAAAAVLAAVDRGFPAFVLALNGQHWVMVTGYVLGTGPQDAVYIGGRWVSDIYVNDPDEDAPLSLQVNTWLTQHIAPVALCGPYVDRMVIVVDGPPGPTTTTTPPSGPSDPVKPGRPKKPKKPKKPRRPPKKPPRPPNPGPDPRRSRAKR
jgi:hypothetical protein